MSAAERQVAWNDIEANGWGAEHIRAGLLYPMPGQPDFDDDDAFRAQAIFPAGAPGKCVLAGDQIWTLPSNWFRAIETRPRNWFTYHFKLKPTPANRDIAQASALAVKRCMYLEIFRSRRPLSLSTLRGRKSIYTAFAQHACDTNRKLVSFDYADIAEVVARLDKASKTALPKVYELLRWWQASSPDGYAMFTPPPSIEAVNGLGEHEGFDPDTIREDAEAEGDKTWQPFSDEFVSAAGEFCLNVLDELRPVVNRCMRAVMDVPMPERMAKVGPIVRSFSWPTDFEAQSRKNLRTNANLCQTATIFIFSLLLGPRWTEVSALPRTALDRKVIDGEVFHVANGLTFKLSDSRTGQLRDWPVSDRIAGYLEAQREYVELAEGPEFQTLFRSHEQLWGGGEPVRNIDHTLKRFVARHGFEPLLNGSNCHHHRFRKTLARLIVIALQGGPVVLRRLFGHEHLAMTLRYILANDSLCDELREIAFAEQKLLSEQLIEKRHDLRGGGADGFKKAIENVVKSLDVTTPQGRRDQASYKAADIVEALSEGSGGLSLKQILPGLVVCFKPPEEAGYCCKHGELPNITKCDAKCGWHLSTPEFIEQARVNVADAMTHLRMSGPTSVLVWRHYSRVVREKVAAYPELADGHAGDRIFEEAMADDDGENS